MLEARFFLGAARMLVSSDNRAVQVQFLEVGVFAEFLEDSVPNLALGPTAEALVHAIPRPEPLRQVTPGRAGPQNPQNGFNKEAVVGCPTPRVRGFARQHLCNAQPLVVS